MPSCGVCCSPSAVAVPCARTCTADSVAGALAASARMPPSSRTGPPSAWACTLDSENPVSLNCTAPRTRVSAGVSGVMRSSLPASVTLPCTLDLLMSLMGRLNRSWKSALPVPLACSSALPVIRPSGEVVMSVSSSASGPRASALTPTTVCARSGMRASTLDSRKPLLPAKPPLAPRTCMDERSKISSPPRSVSAGQGRVPAGCSAVGT